MHYAFVRQEISCETSKIWHLVKYPVVKYHILWYVVIATTSISHLITCCAIVLNGCCCTQKIFFLVVTELIHR